MTVTAGPASERLSARQRLLAAADDLFYDEGVHTVGIDRVIQRAGVAKATLYSTFGSKDELVRAYLTARHERTRARLDRELVCFPTPREQLIGVFVIQGRGFSDPGFRGCAFVGASAESAPDGPVAEAAGAFRGWLRGLFLQLAREAGAAEPEALAQKLVILYDGAGVSAWLDHDPTAADAAVSTATLLVDAALDA